MFMDMAISSIIVTFVIINGIGITITTNTVIAITIGIGIVMMIIIIIITTTTTICIIIIIICNGITAAIAIIITKIMKWVRSMEIFVFLLFTSVKV